MLSVCRYNWEGCLWQFRRRVASLFFNAICCRSEVAPSCLKGHFARLDPQLGDNQLYAHMIPLERKHKRTSLKQRDVFINGFLSLLKSVHFIKLVEGARETRELNVYRFWIKKVWCIGAHCWGVSVGSFEWHSRLHFPEHVMHIFNFVIFWEATWWDGLHNL